MKLRGYANYTDRRMYKHQRTKFFTDDDVEDIDSWMKKYRNKNPSLMITNKEHFKLYNSYESFHAAMIELGYLKGDN